MKKLIWSIFIPCLLLAGCGSTRNEGSSSIDDSVEDIFKFEKKLDVSVICPTGAPAVAFYKYATDKNFETNSNAAQGIIPLMAQGKKDVVILPTNAGINAIRGAAKAPYKIAATITFGNIFLASTGNDDNNKIDDGDYIVLFQQGQIPDLLFHYVYGTSLDSNIHYVSDGSEASKCLKTGKNLTSNNETVDYVLIAQPALEVVMSSTPNVSMAADLQSLYYEKAKSKLFQASIFVNNNTEKGKIDSFLNQIQKDIVDAIYTPVLIKNGLNKAENVSALYGVPSGEIAAEVVENNNGLGLGYSKAKQNKNDIDKSLALFGIEETNEEIYY